MPLQLHGGDVVIGIRVGIRPFRMCRTVTAFAHHPAMTGADPVELRIAGTGIAETVEHRRHRGFGESLVYRHDRRRLGIPRTPRLAQAKAVGVAVGVDCIDDGAGRTCQVAVRITGMAGPRIGAGRFSGYPRV